MSCEERNGVLIYIQIVSIVMPIFCVGLGIIVGYIILTLGTSGMGRHVWKANVRAILDELERETKSVDIAKAEIANTDDLRPNMCAQPVANNPNSTSKH